MSSLTMSFLWQRYEVRWRCSRGLHGYICDYWNTRVVNSTFSLVNVRHYDTSYEFGITVLTSHGRGTPYQLSQFVPPINGMPRDFYCQVTADNTVLTCHWTPPTDFDPDAAEFNVSSNQRNNANFFYDFARQVKNILSKKRETQLR